MKTPPGGPPALIDALRELFDAFGIGRNICGVTEQGPSPESAAEIIAFAARLKRKAAERAVPGSADIARARELASIQTITGWTIPQRDEAAALLRRWPAPPDREALAEAFANSPGIREQMAKVLHAVFSHDTSQSWNDTPAHFVSWIDAADAVLAALRGSGA